MVVTILIKQQYIMKSKYLLLFLLLGLVSCKKESNRAEAEKMVAEWVGKTISFPADIECSYMGKDTVCPDINTPYKVLVYIDSTGCTSCKLQMYKWNTLIKQAEDSMPGKISFRFYFQPKDEKELQFLLKKDSFTHPVYMDKDNKINEANKFPANMNYQCFLLDKEDKVVMIGNPMLNPKIWELYKQTIVGEASVTNSNPLTTIEVEQTEIELKNLKAGEEATAVFILKNTGEKPLLVKDISTSCGCTVPQWEKKPIIPGQKTEIKVKVTPDNSGYFRKTVTVFCNTKEGSTQLTVKSMIKD